MDGADCGTALTMDRVLTDACALILSVVRTLMNAVIPLPSSWDTVPGTVQYSMP